MRKPLIDDGVTRGLEKGISDAASIIRAAISKQRPILIRYNNDADGISAGLCIYRAILHIAKGSGYDPQKLLRDYQNNSAFYEHGDACGDAMLLRGISDSRPLLILVDFGANIESVAGLKAAKAEGAELLIIDHHPPNKDALALLDCIVSPWLEKDGTSDYCAGLIAGEVAKEAAGIDTARIQRIAMAGDRSKLSTPTEEERNAALALDYLAETVRPRNTLAICDSAISDPSKLQAAYNTAASKIESTLSQLREIAKIRKLPNGFVVATAEITRIARDGSFPPKGKVAGTLHDFLASSSDSPIVTIAHGKDAINIRANLAARHAGFNASKIIALLKQELPNAITSGGGHDVAASIRMGKGLGNVVLRDLIGKISAIPA